MREAVSTDRRDRRRLPSAVPAAPAGAGDDPPGATGGLASPRGRIEWHAVIALCITLTLQIVTAAWWASSLNTRLSAIDEWMHANGGIEHRLSKIETRLDTLLERRAAEAGPR